MTGDSPFPPRQSGKTTICRSLFGDLPYVNFERPDTQQRFSEDPQAFLEQYPHGALFDEFQRVPAITSYLQGIVDESGFSGVFVLTGSTNLLVRALSRFQTFLGLCAGRTGQLLNLEQLGNEAGCIASRLPPWHANVSKRLVKTPKLYFHEVGIVSFLLGINETRQLHNHPLRGALFETLVVSDIIKADLVISTGAGNVPVEIKSSVTFSSDFTRGIKQFRFGGAVVTWPRRHQPSFCKKG